jgi:hypothetical protein
MLVYSDKENVILKYEDHTLASFSFLRITTASCYQFRNLLPTYSLMPKQKILARTRGRCDQPIQTKHCHFFSFLITSVLPGVDKDVPEKYRLLFAKNTTQEYEYVTDITTSLIIST